ncbi:hypothetical protein BC628DRAFT_573061 [Trametes gibbosa]|nr:hypothetical protein BC628DRAFT_573061 [Trametes gibbosa]
MHKVACDLSRATGEPCRYTSTTSTPLHFQETNHTWVQTPREWRYPFPEGPVLTSPQSTLPQQCIPRRTDAAALSIVPPDPLSAYDGHTWPAGRSQAVTWIHSDGACTRADCSHEVNASPPMHWSAGSTLCRTDVLPIAWQTSGTELGHNQENYTDNRAAHRVQLGIGCESAGLCGSDAHGPFDGSYDHQPLAIIPRTRDDPGDGSYDQGDLHFSGNAHVNSTLRNWYSQQGVPGRNALQAYPGSEPASTAHQIGRTFSAGTERVTPCIETRWSAAATWPRLPSGESVVGGDVSDLQIWDTEQMLTYDPSDERGEEHLEAFQLHVSHKGET